MIPEHVKNQANALYQLIQFYNSEYYENSNLIVSNEIFDSLVNQLKHWIKVYDLPGGEYSNVLLSVGHGSFSSSKIKHHSKMYSLDNLYDLTHLGKWFSSIRRNIHTSDPLLFNLEYKIDGMAAELVYSYGILTHATTRGDGITGDNILDSCLSIDDIPKNITEIKSIRSLVIFGELYVEYASFEEFKNSPESDLDNPPKSPRSTLGLVRSKNFAKSKLRVKFNPHEIARVDVDLSICDWDEILSQSASEQLNWLCQFGFNRIKPIYTRVPIKKIIDTSHSSRSFIGDLPYPCDGLVISIDDISYRVELDYTARVPKWAIAYKFPAEVVESTIKRVDWQVTVTGKLCPVMIYSPVEIKGHAYTHASLSNLARFKSLGPLRLGMRVTITLNGDVMPYVQSAMNMDDGVGVATSLTPIIAPPTHCPCCDSTLKLQSTSTSVLKSSPELYCLNRDLCSEQITLRIHSFVSTKAMSIAGFGLKLIRQLVRGKWLQYLTDVYKLDRKKIEFKGKEKILMSIESSLQRDFLYVLNGFPGIKLTQKNIRYYCESFANLSELAEAAQLEDDRIHSEFSEYLRDNYLTMLELYHLGVGRNNTLYVR